MGNAPTTPDSADALRDALLTQSTTRQTETIDLGDLGEAKVKSRSESEINQISRKAQRKAANGEIGQGEARQRLLVIACLYGPDGEQLFSESHFDQLGEVQAVDGSWLQRAYETIAYLHGSQSDEPTAHKLATIVDRVEEAEKAIKQSDRVSGELEGELIALISDLHEHAEQALEAENSNLTIR